MKCLAFLYCLFKYAHKTELMDASGTMVGSVRAAEGVMISQLASWVGLMPLLRGCQALSSCAAQRRYFKQPVLTF